MLSFARTSSERLVILSRAEGTGDLLPGREGGVSTADDPACWIKLAIDAGERPSEAGLRDVVGA
jgi:hypothetical protein